MNITDIKIRRIYQDPRLKALVSISLDQEFAVHDIKVIAGPDRLFVAMPSRKDENGSYRDIVHPISPQMRRRLEEEILRVYGEFMDQRKEPSFFKTEEAKNDTPSEAPIRSPADEL